MKKLGHFSSLLIILVLLIGYITNAQEVISCKVLLEPISETYIGDCKNGLANGKGMAQGTDKYEGKFKEGLPNGKGKYTWANGDYFEGNWKNGQKNGKGSLYTSSSNRVLQGFWKDDNFVKEITEAPYKITYANNATATIQERVGANPGSVEIVFVRERETRDFPDLMLAGSSGTYTRGSSYSNSS
jgi:hypothetical protein